MLLTCCFVFQLVWIVLILIGRFRIAVLVWLEFGFCVRLYWCVALFDFTLFDWFYVTICGVAFWCLVLIGCLYLHLLFDFYVVWLCICWFVYFDCLVFLLVLRMYLLFGCLVTWFLFGVLDCVFVCFLLVVVIRFFCFLIWWLGLFIWCCLVCLRFVSGNYDCMLTYDLLLEGALWDFGCFNLFVFIYFVFVCLMLLGDFIV